MKKFIQGRRWGGLVLALASGLSLTACQTMTGSEAINPALAEGSPSIPVTTAALPKAVQGYDQVDSALACIRHSGRYLNQTFLVVGFVDATGKFNGVAQGATGKFLPEAGTAVYITAALKKAGADVIANYATGMPSVPTKIDHQMTGYFNTLDFGQPMQLDAQIAGAGPLVTSGWAQLSMAIQLDNFTTKKNEQVSQLERPVRYTQVGATAGKLVGSTLVTGGVSFQDQQRLQLEAVNGPIALGVADVLMKQDAYVRRSCRGIVADLLDKKIDMAELH